MAIEDLVAVGIPDINAFGPDDNPASFRRQFPVIGKRMQVMTLIPGLPVAGGILISILHRAYFYCVSFCFFSSAVTRMKSTVAYAIWTGIGTELIAPIEVVYVREGVDTDTVIDGMFPMPL